MIIIYHNKRYKLRSHSLEERTSTANQRKIAQERKILEKRLNMQDRDRLKARKIYEEGLDDKKRAWKERPIVLLEPLNIAQPSTAASTAHEPPLNLLNCLLKVKKQMRVMGVNWNMEVRLRRMMVKKSLSHKTR